MLKYLPTPKQLARWRNETTFYLTFFLASAETVRDYLESADISDPAMWLKGLGIVGVGIVQRWNAYGKETIEVDLPKLAAVPEPVETEPVDMPPVFDPGIEAGILFEEEAATVEAELWQQ